ncbi:MAG: hypothetical protein ACYDAQ_19055, partial [Mycobacteriales bacterium]
GLNAADARTLRSVVQHHLLLADTAVRRDVADPATVEMVATAVGSAKVLDLVRLLTIADGLATGPAAWGARKAGQVGRLAGAVEVVLGGQPPPPRPAPSPQAELAVRRFRATQAGEVLLQADWEVGTVTVAAADAVGLLAASTGVLALHGLDVRSVLGIERQGVAVLDFQIQARLGGVAVDESRLREELRATLQGTFPLELRLGARAGAYRSGAPASAQVGAARIVNGASRDNSVLEVRAPDRVGLLHEIATVLAELAVPVRAAYCSTLGYDVLDSFYLPLLAASEGPRLLAALEPVLHPGPAG